MKLGLDKVDKHWLEVINNYFNDAMLMQSQVLKDADYDRESAIKIVVKKVENWFKIFY